jgi:hypothetical protein
MPPVRQVVRVVWVVWLGPTTQAAFSLRTVCRLQTASACMQQRARRQKVQRTPPEAWAPQSSIRLRLRLRLRGQGLGPGQLPTAILQSEAGNLKTREVWQPRPGTHLFSEQRQQLQQLVPTPTPRPQPSN